MSINYKLLEQDDERFLTVYRSGEPPLLASPETHGNFDELVRLAVAGDDSVVELFDTGRAIEKAFADVVEGRVAIRGGVVFYDDDPMDNSITNAILRFHEQGENLAPMVAFMDNVMANPQVESREQFYRFIEEYKFPIDDEGYIVAYKGVRRHNADEEGVYRSLHAGHAFVNGKEYLNDLIPNKVGDVVTMPRSEVDFDPNSACSSGLHAGTHGYAKTYASGGALMYVRINPRDVVSVPHDVSSQKVRVCRYEVVDFADTAQENESAHWKNVRSVDVVNSDEDYDEDEDDFYYADDEDYGDGEDVYDDLGDDNEDSYEDSVNGVQSFDGFKVGDRVKVTGRESWSAQTGMTHGKSGTVTGFADNTRPWAYVLLDGSTSYAFWLSDLTHEAEVSDKTDTRKNHLSQKRGPGGRFLPKGS